MDKITAVEKVLKNAHFNSSSLAGETTLLWINLMEGSEPSRLEALFAEYFLIKTPEDYYRNAAEKSYDKPAFLCFEYDYPNCHSLKILKEFCQLYPCIPAIMFTVHHSEELAVWALRNRVWDYHYKPLDERKVGDIAQEMRKYLQASRSDQSPLSSQHLNSSYPDEVRFGSRDSSQTKVDIAVNFIHQHYSKKITESDAAKVCHLSRFQFSRLFRKVTGLTFQNYLLNYRINIAKTLLRNPDAKVVDIAFAVGFKDPSYFARVFKRLVGTPPSDHQPGWHSGNAGNPLLTIKKPKQVNVSQAIKSEL